MNISLDDLWLLYEFNRLATEYQAKQRYYSNLGDKLSDPSTGEQTAFKRIAKIKKYTNVPPLNENDMYTNFQKKANIFNEYFSNQ